MDEWGVNEQPQAHKKRDDRRLYGYTVAQIPGEVNRVAEQEQNWKRGAGVVEDQQPALVVTGF